jgi:hypothetical protein
MLLKSGFGSVEVTVVYFFTYIIYGYGTFYASPTQLTQLYTLHAMVDDVMYPLVFGLLLGKSEEIYDRYFNIICLPVR